MVANDLDARPQHVAPCARADQLHAEPVVPAPDRVHQQANRSVDIADDHVDVAVVVDVAERRSATDVEQLEHGARVPGDVLESSVAQIPEQELSLAVRKQLVAALPDRFDRSVDCQEVQPAVVVEIEPGRSEAGVSAAHRPKPRRRAQILEQSGAEIDVKVVPFSR